MGLGTWGVISSALLLTAVAAAAQTPAPAADPAAQYKALADANSLNREGLKPWHLKMSFTLYDAEGEHGQNGTLEEWWASPNSRRVVISSPAFSETIPFEGQPPDSANRAAYLIHQLLDETVEPIPTGGVSAKIPEQEKAVSFGKVKLSCLASPLGLACAIPGTNKLRLQLTGGVASVRDQIGSFQGQVVAGQLSIVYEGREMITGHIDELQTYDPQTTTLPMQTMQPHVSKVPGKVMAGRIVKYVKPEYPEVARSARLSGTVYVDAIIGKDGIITSLDVISSRTSILSQAALDAVKQWTYQPFMLNGKPTEVATMIVVNFNLR